MKKGDKDKSKTPLSGPFHNPFAKLAPSRATLPSGPEPSPPAPGAAGPARAIVRMERTGRGGKEVTVVEGLALPEKELLGWLKALKQSLGCGGVVEEDRLVLQGDQRERLPALLQRRGVQRVTLGN